MAAVDLIEGDGITDRKIEKDLKYLIAGWSLGGNVTKGDVFPSVSIMNRGRVVRCHDSEVIDRVYEWLSKLAVLDGFRDMSPVWESIS